MSGHTTTVGIRRETPGDEAEVRRVNELAFNQGMEANLVDRLRATCADYLSFVAVDSDRVVGHILFTPVTLDGSELSGMGLAPMAVLPAQQRRGIGSRLVRHGLDHLRRAGCPFVVVVGHPGYYPRFGFEKASAFNLRSQWDGIPDEAFMVAVFQADALPAHGSVVRYRPEFDDAL